jgi:hypothetical protein
MELTKEQVDRIEMYVIQSRVTMSSLRDDLIDHLCCAVETRLAHENEFEKSFEEALAELAPAGLYQIEENTEFLLHPNKVIMKKLTYFIGLAATISMSMGLMLKILHMPGGEQFVNYGFFAFAGIFMPAIVVRKISQPSQLNAVEKLKLVLGIASAIGLVLTLVTKMNHGFATATIMFFCTATLFSFGFLPLHFYQMYRNSLREAN